MSEARTEPSRLTARDRRIAVARVRHFDVFGPAFGGGRGARPRAFRSSPPPPDPSIQSPPPRFEAEPLQDGQRLLRPLSAFVAEVKASAIRTLDALNEAFLAWGDREYNSQTHGETGETPIGRWRVGIANIRYAEDDALRRAFQWKETRKADKSGPFSLFGVRFQVGVTLARKEVEIRYDPEQLSEIEVWHDGAFAERLRPFVVQPHRRPQTVTPPVPVATPVADWLSHLTERRRSEGFVEPGPRQIVDDAKTRRAAQDAAVVALLADRLDPGVRDDDAVERFLARFGPVDLELATAAVDQQVAKLGCDQHVRRYLDAIRRAGAR